MSTKGGIAVGFKKENPQLIDNTFITTMAKIVYAALLILAVCVIYSYAADRNACYRYCVRAILPFEGDPFQNCLKKGPKECKSLSGGEVKFVKNYGNCNCCTASCVEYVGEGKPCGHFYTGNFAECKEGKCVNDKCTKK